MNKYKLHSHAWKMIPENGGEDETEYEGYWVKWDDIKVNGLITILIPKDEDQPTACHKCGSRTDFIDIDKLTQRHTCINRTCGTVFKTEFEQ